MTPEYRFMIIATGLACFLGALLAFGLFGVMNLLLDPDKPRTPAETN